MPFNETRNASYWPRVGEGIATMQRKTEAERGPADAGEETTYLLLPVVDEPGEFVAVFSDGSYTRWIPSGARAD